MQVVDGCWDHKDIYLRYHVEHLLEQFYITHERVDGLLDIVIARRRALGDEKGTQAATTLKKQFAKRMKPLNRLRGIHVHERPYKDSVIESLDTLEMIRMAQMDFPSRLVSQLYRLAFEHWAEFAREQHGELESLTDFVCEQLVNILF